MLVRTGIAAALIAAPLAFAAPAWAQPSTDVDCSPCASVSEPPSWEQLFAGDPWGKAFAGDPWGKAFAGDPWGKAFAGDPWGKAFGNGAWEKVFSPAE